jgi:hypothetical protein
MERLTPLLFVDGSSDGAVSLDGLSALELSILANFSHNKQVLIPLHPQVAIYAAEKYNLFWYTGVVFFENAHSKAARHFLSCQNF